jgi:hypothetical protein
MPNQHANDALTLYLNATDESVLRISVGAPAIDSRNGDPVVTVTLSVSWGSNKLAQDQTQAPPPTETKLLRFPSRFRNWYLCERDGAEWSLEVDDPTCTDSCPICTGKAAAIAVLGLPVDGREERPEEYRSQFKLCRDLKTVSRN